MGRDKYKRRTARIALLGLLFAFFWALGLVHIHLYYPPPFMPGDAHHPSLLFFSAYIIVAAVAFCVGVVGSCLGINALWKAAFD